MEIRHIKYFIQVYHDLNITRASKSLFISQQALSKAIVNLEEEIGCPLFERSVSGLNATRYADIGFILAAAQAELPPQMEVCCKGKDEITCCVVMHKDNPLANNKMITVKNLKGQALLFLDSYHQLNSYIEEEMLKQKIEFKHHGESSLESFFTQINVGTCAGFCSSELLRYFHFPDLVCVSLSLGGQEEQKLNTYLVVWEKRVKTKEMRHYINYFQDKNK